MKKQIQKFLKTKSDTTDLKWYANERHIYETVLQEFMEFRKANKNWTSGGKNWTPSDKNCTLGYKGWIKWKGGDMPVESCTPIEVKYRCGDVEECEAGDLGSEDWSHTGHNYDIIAYKVL